MRREECGEDLGSTYVFVFPSAGDVAILSWRTDEAVRGNGNTGSNSEEAHG